MKFHQVAAIAVVLAVPALAHATVPVDAMKARVSPASDTLEAAQICAAMSLAYALTLAGHPEYKDKADSYSVLARMWTGIAADKSGMSYDDYLDKELPNDLQSLTQLDGDTLDDYDFYCSEASREVIAAAHQQ